jgi:spore germination cell wall hydrolase CwlJ-like protein
LKFVPKARADWPALMCAALIGSGVGLGLGASYLAAGMARHAADHARGRELAQAAAGGYADRVLDARGRGLRAGHDLYGLRAEPDAPTIADRLADGHGAAKARRPSDLQCLTAAVYYEARGEGPRGQAAVAQVVMNRVKSPAFPSTVCGVVYQGAGHRGCQFSFACDGSMDRVREAAAWSRARRIAARALAGFVMGEVGAATHFHTATVAPVWGPQMLRVATVGVHEFYRFAPRRASARPAPEPLVQQAVLTAAPVGKVEDLRVTPRIEMAVAASLQPVSGEGPLPLQGVKTAKAETAGPAAPKAAPAAGESAAAMKSAAAPAAKTDEAMQTKAPPRPASAPTRIATQAG